MNALMDRATTTFSNDVVSQYFADKGINNPIKVTNETFDYYTNNDLFLDGPWMTVVEGTNVWNKIYGITKDGLGIFCEA